MADQIIFRVDANQQIGYGHLVRCISIANAIHDKALVFISTDHLEAFLKKECTTKYEFIFIEDSQSFFSYLEFTDIVIIDGYQFDVSYHKKIKNLGIKYCAIDDLAKQELFADIVINPTPLFKTSEYRTPLYTQFLTGLKYALLRSAFLKLAKRELPIKNKNSLIICFGGSDPMNKTKNALEAIVESDQFNEIHVVLGPAYQFFNSLEDILAAKRKVKIHTDLNELEMSELMAASEYAILPSSGILLEGLAAKMKIISGYYIDNQKQVYQNHLSLNHFVDGKNFSVKDLKTALERIKDFTLSSNPIDGKSIDRIVKVINQLTIENDCILRKATQDDTLITFQWASDPETRKYAFNKSDITFENHLIWFNKKIQESTCFYYILEIGNNPIGSIRFDLADKKALISYLIAPDQHGKGYGSIILKLGLKAITKECKEEDVILIEGYVFKENIASIKTFEKFGFDKMEENNSILFTKKFKSDV